MTAHAAFTGQAFIIEVLVEIILDLFLYGVYLIVAVILAKLIHAIRCLGRTADIGNHGF